MIAVPCRRHDWAVVDGATVCRRCGHVRDEAASRRGRNNRARGKRVERTEMRKAGQHTGNANGADDGMSVDGLFAYQSKALASGRFPSWMTRELDKLRLAHRGRVPVLLVAETAGRGIKGQRIAVVAWADWLDLHGAVAE